MSTLAQILTSLPTVLRKRYSDSFWIFKANQILGEVETKTRGYKFLGQSLLLLQDKRTIYPVPTDLRTIDRIRVPDATQVQINPYDWSTTVHFRLVGDKIILDAFPDMSGYTAYGPETAVTVTGSRVISSVAAADVTEDQYVGWVMVDETNGGWSFVAANEAAESGNSFDITVNEAFASLTDGDEFSLQPDFYIIEGQKGMTRFSATSDSAPLPAEWESILTKGLRYYSELQTDEESQQLQTWRADYLNELDAYQSEISSPIGDRGRMRPIPDSRWSSL